jgi:anthranilate synthase component 1
MDFKAFKGAWSERSTVHLSVEVPADLLTPASVFLKLGGDKAKASFLLESVEAGENVGRYSIIGVDPSETIVLTARECRHTIDGTTQSYAAKELGRLIRSRLPSTHSVDSDGAFGLTGGWVGYLGYDCVRLFERLPARTSDTTGHPWAMLGLYKRVVVFDHARQTACAVATAGRAIDERSSAKTAYDSAQRGLDDMVRRLLKSHPMPDMKPLSEKRATSNTTRAAFSDGVRTFKKHIGRGDIFQGVLSQRFSVPGTIPSFDVYRRLRRSNPSPYMYFLRCGNLAIAGSSPETLVQKCGTTVTTRPIAGTRPRGATPSDDARLERNLLASVKENAEHIMLVDLGRNDLGRVCRPGTVATGQLRVIDRYSHVMHLVSSVSGQARRSVDSFDVLAATFPAGTVTGAPKIRAMELINAVEPDRRGVYAGCVGYIDWYDNLDMAIAIRTAVIDKMGGSVQAGAGIVADSDPDREYKETCNKAAAPLLALGGVIEGK